MLACRGHPLICCWCQRTPFLVDRSCAYPQESWCSYQEQLSTKNTGWENIWLVTQWRYKAKYIFVIAYIILETNYEAISRLYSRKKWWTERWCIKEIVNIFKKNTVRICTGLFSCIRLKDINWQSLWLSVKRRKEKSEQVWNQKLAFHKTKWFNKRVINKKKKKEDGHNKGDEVHQMRNYLQQTIILVVLKISRYWS